MTSDERRETSGGLHLDQDLGTLAIDTPRTCGGFAERGRIDAGPLSFTLIASGKSAASPPVSGPSALSGAAPLSQLSGEAALNHLTT